jgi:hypothetical protein
VTQRPKRPRSKPDLADRFCEAIKHLTAERTSRTYATQWISVHGVARHLGITEEEPSKRWHTRWSAIASRPMAARRRTA